jgi:hypothetical protein
MVGHPIGADERRSSSLAKPVLSTLSADADQLWADYVQVVDSLRGRSLLTWLRDFWRQSDGRRALVLRGTVAFADRYCDLVGAVLVKARRRRPLVIISDATIEPGSRAFARRIPRPAARLIPALSRLLIRAVDGSHVRWCVLSTDELRTFPEVWRVAPERVYFTPMSHTLWGGGENIVASDEGFLFAGGDSLRDYELLAAAVLGSNFDVRIATSWKPVSPQDNLDVGRLSHDEFLARMRASHAVVVPIERRTRSAGQQTYLNAMALGKPVIVTDAPGVRDYIQHEVTGFIVPPEVQALRQAIEHVMDPKNADEIAVIGRRARETVLARFNEFAYRRQLLSVAGVLPRE